MYQVIYNVHVWFVSIHMYVRVGVTSCFKRKKAQKVKKNAASWSSVTPA